MVKALLVVHILQRLDLVDVLADDKPAVQQAVERLAIDLVLATVTDGLKRVHLVGFPDGARHAQ